MKKISRKTLIIAGLIVLASAGSGGALYLRKAKDNPVTTQSTDQSSDREEPQFPGPTDEEKQAADQHKDELVKQQEAESKPQTGQKAVTPIVTSVNQNGQEIFASGFVPGIFEDGGTCVFTFKKGGHQVVRNVQAFANASTTNCANVTVPRGEFAEPGAWELIISYGSPKAKGDSQAKQFQVQ